MNLDVSDDSSDDDELSIILKRKKPAVPDEFSIDNLLKARANESSGYQTPIRQTKKAESPIPPENEEKPKKINIINLVSSTTDDELLDQMGSFPIIHRDGSIFEFSQSSATMDIFSFIEKDQMRDDSEFETLFSSIPTPEKWQYQAICTLPNFVKISSQTLFSFILHMINTKDQEIGISIVRYYERFPKNSIEYHMWYELLKKSKYEKFFPGMQILLILTDISKFSFETEDEYRRAPFEIIILHFYSLLCPEISENSKYRKILPSLKKILIDTEHIFTEDNLSELIQACYSIATEFDILNLNYIISLFPFDGLGCELMLGVMMRLFLRNVGIFDFPDFVTIDYIAELMPQIKQLCMSLTTEDLRKASAAMALAEKILVASIIKKKVRYNVAEKMSKNMKFSINCPNPGVLTAIKEQIHLTRSQIDCFIQAKLV